MFAELRRQVANLRPELEPTSKETPTYFCSYRSAHKGVLFGWDIVEKSSKLRSILYIDTADKAFNKTLFDNLHNQKSKIEHEVVS